MVPRVACLVVILVTEVSRLLSSRFGETSIRLGDEKHCRCHGQLCEVGRIKRDAGATR